MSDATPTEPASTQNDLPLTENDLALTENDLAERSLIEPAEVVRPRPELPTVAVACFFREVLDNLETDGMTTRVGRLQSEQGTHPIWRLSRPGGDVLLFQPGVGAPLVTGFVEEVIAHGVTTVVAVGGCGALRPELTLGHAVVVDRALRDEGTSFHYLPASRWVEADPDGVAVLHRVLEAAGTPYLTGATWTTDAIYRETRSRAERRAAEGCLVVEMEASALIAVARYRGIRLAQLLYAGDTLAEPTWQSRGWQDATTVRLAAFELAVDAALDWHRAAGAAASRA